MVLSGTVTGQSYIGIFSDISRVRFSGDSPDRGYYKRITGYGGGVNLDLRLSNRIFLSLQPSFSQEGTRIEYNVKGMDERVDSIRIKFNYAALPILIKVSASNKRFYAICGLEIAYLMHSKFKSGGELIDPEEDIAELNFTVHFGAGLRIPVRRSRFFVELRYMQGLNNLTDHPIERSYIPRVKTSGFKLTFGYEIPISNPEK